MVIQVTPNQPFNFRETLWFLDRGLDDCMHEVRPGAARRAIRTSQGNALAEITGNDSALYVSVLAGSAAPDELCSYVTEWFDLDRDIRPFYRLLRKDHEFVPLATRYKGFRMVGIPDLYECLLWSISGQQISLPFAYTLKRRLVETFGEQVQHKGVTYHLFPTPAQMAGVKPSQLREMQFTTRKAEYITGITEAFLNDRLSKQGLLAMKDEAAMLRHLLKFRGIGPWTANYVLMKSVRAMNCVPYGDAGLNQALAKLKKFPGGTSAEVDELLKEFAGWRTYLVYYLWRSLREMA